MQFCMCKTSSVIAKHQCSSSLSLILFNWGGLFFFSFLFLAHASWKMSLFSSNCRKVYNCCYTAQDIFCACWNTCWNDCDMTNQSRFSVHVTRTQCLVLGSCCNLFSVYSIRMVVLSLGQLFGAAVVPCATHCDFVFNRLCFYWVELWYAWCWHKCWWRILLQFNACLWTVFSNVVRSFHK